MTSESRWEVEEEVVGGNGERVAVEEEKGKGVEVAVDGGKRRGLEHPPEFILSTSDNKITKFLSEINN